MTVKSAYLLVSLCNDEEQRGYVTQGRDYALIWNSLLHVSLFLRILHGGTVTNSYMSKQIQLLI